MIATLARSACCWLAQDLAADLDFLAGEGGVQAVERGALTLVFVAQGGAVERRERLAFGHRVARVHDVVDGAGRGCEQRGADCGDHGALRGDVANEVALRDAHHAQALGRHGVLQVGPLRQQHDEQRDDEHERAAGDVEHPTTLPVRAVVFNWCILPFGGADRGLRGRGERESFELCDFHGVCRGDLPREIAGGVPMWIFGVSG